MPNMKMKYGRIADADPQTPIPEPSWYSRSPRPTPTAESERTMAKPGYSPVDREETVPRRSQLKDLQQLQMEIAALRVETGLEPELEPGGGAQWRAGAQEMAPGALLQLGGRAARGSSGAIAAMPDSSTKKRGGEYAWVESDEPPVSPIVESQHRELSQMMQEVMQRQDAVAVAATSHTPAAAPTPELEPEPEPELEPEPTLRLTSPPRTPGRLDLDLDLDRSASTNRSPSARENRWSIQSPVPRKAAHMKMRGPEKCSEKCSRCLAPCGLAWTH
eukprot:COSAG06_NODE_16303_length_1008_cov_1.320132_1_plen_274_part_01